MARPARCSFEGGLGLDLDLPARIEQPRDHGSGRGPDLAAPPAVRARHFLVVLAAGDEDARPHAVLEARAAPPESANDQARLCLEIIGEALGRAGARFEDVVRTRIFVTGREHYEEVARAHGEVFGEIRPASTAVVTGLLDARWKVEIEAEALAP